MWASIVQAPTNPQLDGNLIVVNGNSIKGTNLPFYPEIATYGTFIGQDAVEISLVAEKYGISEYKFLNLLNEECNFVKSNEECIGDNGRAYGRAQFHIGTFNQYCEGDYKDEFDQIECCAQMWEMGIANEHFSACRKIGGCY